MTELSKLKTNIRTEQSWEMSLSSRYACSTLTLRIMLRFGKIKSKIYRNGGEGDKLSRSCSLVGLVVNILFVQLQLPNSSLRKESFETWALNSHNESANVVMGKLFLTVK